MLFLRKFSFFSTKIFLSAVLVAIVISGGIFYWQSINTNNTNQTVPVENSIGCKWSSELPVEGKQIYRNEKYCFEMQYPSFLTQISNPSTEGLFIDSPYTLKRQFNDNELCLQSKTDFGKPYPENPCTFMISLNATDFSSPDEQLNKEYESSGVIYQKWVEDFGGTYQHESINGVDWLYVYNPEGEGLGSMSYYRVEPIKFLLISVQLVPVSLSFKSDPVVQDLLTSINFY